MPSHLEGHSDYGKLDNTKQEIRLLFLQPASRLDDPIIADLKVVSLHEQPKYEAISYCWGDASETRDIQIQGCKATVTASLFGALRRLRFPEKPRILWADAICINQ